MPAIYTHYSFGKRVYKSLPEDLKDIVRHYKTEFVNGLQGPDPLFFFNPFRATRVEARGHEIHKEKASVFLNPALKVLAITGLDSSEGAYIMGFICHYMLDSACHGMVSRNVKETGICHTEQETELDRYMMEKECWDAVSFPAFLLVNTSRDLAETMAVFYKGVSTYSIHACQRRMRLIKRMLYCPGSVKRWILIHLAKVLYGGEDGHVYQIMAGKANPDCEPLCRQLADRLQETVPECVRELEYFARVSMDKGILSPRMERNFE